MIFTTFEFFGSVVGLALLVILQFVIILRIRSRNGSPQTSGALKSNETVLNEIVTHDTLCKPANKSDMGGKCEVNAASKVKNNTSRDDEAKGCASPTVQDSMDSLGACLSRQQTLKELLESLHPSTHNATVWKEACTSILEHIHHSDASVHYLGMENGAAVLNNALNSLSDDRHLQGTILEILCYFTLEDVLFWKQMSFNPYNAGTDTVTFADNVYQDQPALTYNLVYDETRTQLLDTIDLDYFMTPLRRRGEDTVIVQNCCMAIGNLANSETSARSLVNLGCIGLFISTTDRYKTYTSVLANCITALGNLAAHDSICIEVEEAGATKTVVSVLQSYPLNSSVQESGFWVTACLSKSEPSCKELLQSGVMNIYALTQLIQTDTKTTRVQEYCCWILCNVVHTGLTISDNDSIRTSELLIRCMQTFAENLELQEHVCSAISTMVSRTTCVHETFVRSDGINYMIELMKNYEYSEDVQINSAKVIGNLAVHGGELCCHLEDVGSSKAVITSMLNNPSNIPIQLTGCLTLTNLSVPSDNKYRILTNGGVQAGLNAMRQTEHSEHVQLSALRLLDTLVESGVEKTALENIESVILDLRQMMPRDANTASGLCTFYENILKIDGACSGHFNEASMDTVAHIIRTFDDTYISITGCRIISLVAAGDRTGIITKDVVGTILSVMRRNESDCDIQIVGCGTIYLIVSKGSSVELLKGQDCVGAISAAQKRFPNDDSLQEVSLMVLDNM